jgi:hypothetical protein
MIGDQTKILLGPGMLNRPTPWEIGITPVGIVAQDQLLRSLCNGGFIWEPGQIGKNQFPSRFQPSFHQRDHALLIEIEPTLPTTDNIEGLSGACCVFGSTGHKMDIEVLLSSELLGSRNLLCRDVDTDDVSPLSGKGTC